MKKCNNPISPQLVIPASFAECMTYEKQILWLNKEIENLYGIVDPDTIAELRNQITLLEQEIDSINVTLEEYNFEAIEQSINQLEMSIQLVINSLDDYATKTDISDMETKTDAAETYATKTDISDMETKTDAAETYATKGALNLKQDALTFDLSPQPNSRNPVWSEGIYEAIQNAGKGYIMDEDASFVCQYYGSPDIINGKVYFEQINEPKNSISPWYSSEITGKIQQTTAIIDLPLSTSRTDVDHIIIDFEDYTPYKEYLVNNVQYVVTMKNAIAISSGGTVKAHLQYVTNPTKHSNFTKPALESIETSIGPFSRIIIYAEVIAYKITTT